MRLNPKLPISDRFQSRIAAQAIVYHQFDPKVVVAVLRPDLKCYRLFFAKLMDEPAVRQEIEAIMSRTERNAQKFMKLMWDWVEEEGVELDVAGGKVKQLTKQQAELKQTAARILAKGYVSDRKPDAPARPMHVDGLDEGMTSLTGEAKKVM